MAGAVRAVLAVRRLDAALGALDGWAGTRQVRCVLCRETSASFDGPAAGPAAQGWAVDHVAAAHQMLPTCFFTAFPAGVAAW
ncbi:hypothetical protein SMD11_3379 [Streptomyces albireticuli]|uniref:Uncharacterized protein n=1 Tax=Streptomyces albireticuli TaxID=1940 RepID=A0A1Z2L3Y8_9ACTN|nr:hypothetical protein SMD11_3379 [Streptomyces albireticuli]